MEKQRWEDSEKRRETVRKKKMQVREKVEKSRNTVFFPMICGTSGSKSRLAKAAGAKPSGQMRDEQLHAVVARSTFPSKNVQNTPFSDHFWKFRWWKSARVVARSTFPSQNVQSTPASEHFWKLTCWKSARRCCAKHISMSNVLKTDGFGAFFEVKKLKTCMA